MNNTTGQPTREETRLPLQQFRQEIYGCFKRRGDALFNVCDALLSESQAQSLPELSLSAACERTWASVYKALEKGYFKI
jgi:hypothetical protein